MSHRRIRHHWERVKLRRIRQLAPNSWRRTRHWRMRVHTTHRQRLHGKRNHGDRIPDGLHGASFHKSWHGAHRGSRRIGDLAVPSSLLEVRIRTSCTLWGGGPLRPPSASGGIPSPDCLSNPSSCSSHCFYILFLSLSDCYLHVNPGISFHSLWRFH